MSVSVAGAKEGAVAAGAEADRRQADYFRDLLQQRFSQLSAEIAGHYRRLTRHQIRDDFSEVRRIRRMIRAEEQEQRALQRMIEALDERFPAAHVRTHSSARCRAAANSAKHDQRPAG